MNYKELKLLSNSVRQDVIEMVYYANSGHIAGALGMSDVLVYLYKKILKFNVKNSLDSKRDFFFLSNGHTCAALYSVLARVGFYSQKELLTFRKLNSKLQGHPHVGSLPGIENSGGPLGQGISQAAGLAHSLKRDKKKNKVFCFVGDGELEEGQCWEALMYAGANNLDNLTIIVDRNHIQIDGDTKNVEKIDPLNKKITAFNLIVIEFDGNDFNQIELAFKHANNMKKPVCLIANNIPGKGVSFMENDFHWHGKAPNKEEFKQAMNELQKERGNIK